MGGGTRIPRKDSEFYNYINRTTDYLTESSDDISENWERLGLLPEIKSAWLNFRSNFAGKYLLSTDRSKRTATITAEKNTVKNDFIAFAERPLKLIEMSPNLLQDDRDIFNIRKPDRTPSARSAIREAPVTQMRPQQGCGVLFTHRRTHDANRASIHPEAHGVETRWILLDKDAAPPASPEVCTHTEFSSRAIHRLWLDIANAGKRLHCFSRWRNNSDEQKSSPWGHRMTMVLSD